jgi:hypothetical protein
MTIKQKMTDEDPVSEVRRIRDAHAKKFNYDLRAIFEDFRRFEKEQNLKTVTLPIKRIGQTGS